MRVVRRVEREAFWKRFQQTRIRRHRVPNHRRIGFKRDVDRRHRSLLLCTVRLTHVRPFLLRRLGVNFYCIGTSLRNANGRHSAGGA
jgi:hypothetical protein